MAEQQYKCKNIIVTRSSYSALGDFLGLGRSTISAIMNQQSWPASCDKKELQETIRSFMRDIGCSEYEVDNAFELEPFSYLTKSNKLQDHQPKSLILRRPTMLTDDALQAFNFEHDPFENEIKNPDQILLMPQHKRVLNQMFAAAKQQKFIAVVGEVGAGKSIVKQLLRQRLDDESGYMISEPQVVEKERAKPSALIQSMLFDFLYQVDNTLSIDEIERHTRKLVKRNLEQNARMLKATLEQKADDKKKLVLICEEAHRYDRETMKALKSIWEMAFKKILAIILIGQPELERRFRADYSIREVARRATLVTLDPIPNALKQYIEHRIAFAGGQPETCFSNGTIKTVAAKLEGFANPLNINNLMSASFQKAFDLGEKQVTAEVVEQAFEELTRVVKQ